MSFEDFAFAEVNKTIDQLNFDTIPETRIEQLQELIDYLQDKQDNGDEIYLNFICTHNSRRSHLAQVWAQVAADYYQIPKIFCYSGGTTTTAMFPKIAETLKSQGLKIQKLSEGNNPVYAIKYDENAQPIVCFSKDFGSDFNPKTKFIAIMTCSDADKNCPFVTGAEKRLALTYEDPKEFDNTPKQTEMYAERSLQIATELFYVFSEVL